MPRMGVALAGTIKGTRGGSELGGGGREGRLAPEKSNLQGRGPLCMSPHTPSPNVPTPFPFWWSNRIHCLSPTPASSQGSVSWKRDQMQPEKGPPATAALSPTEPQERG